MGLMDFLRQWQGSRLAAGVVASLALHLILIALAVGVRLPGRYDVRRGEPLIVELPKADDSPPPGPGGSRASVPPSVRATSSTTQRPWSPPVPNVAAKPAAPHVAPDRPAAPPPPQPQAEAQRVASAVATKSPDGDIAVPQPAPATREAAPTAERVATEPAPRPTAEHAAERQVAALPSAPPPGRPDALAALRRGAGGAGGSGQGRGGIEGEPIPLDSPDPRYSDYLEQVRRRIKEKWGYPCEKNEQTRVCEYRSTQLIIDFGIAKSGELVFVTLTRTSGHAIYDDYALNAVKLASPFPPIPDSFSKKGVPISAGFHYVLQSTLTNILR